MFNIENTKTQSSSLLWPMGVWTGVQKERMVPEDMYVLSSSGSILSSPLSKPFPYKPPKCSDCASLFLKVSSL